MAFNWTPEAIEQAMLLRNSGISSAAAAQKMGISKNAFLGRVIREEIRRGLRTRTVTAETVEKRKYTKREASTTLATAPFILKLVVSNDAPRTRTSILDCTGCKWPVEEDDKIVGGFAFCNQPKDDARYCLHHRQMSRVLVMPRYLHLNGVRR